MKIYHPYLNIGRAHVKKVNSNVTVPVLDGVDRRSFSNQNLSVRSIQTSLDVVNQAQSQADRFNMYFDRSQKKQYRIQRRTNLTRVASTAEQSSNEVVETLPPEQQWQGIHEDNQKNGNGNRNGDMAVQQLTDPEEKRNGYGAQPLMESIDQQQQLPPQYPLYPPFQYDQAPNNKDLPTSQEQQDKLESSGRLEILMESPNSNLDLSVVQDIEDDIQKGNKNTLNILQETQNIFYQNHGNLRRLQNKQNRYLKNINEKKDPVTVRVKVANKVETTQRNNSPAQKSEQAEEIAKKRAKRFHPYYEKQERILMKHASNRNKMQTARSIERSGLQIDKVGQVGSMYKISPPQNLHKYGYTNSLNA